MTILTQPQQIEDFRLAALKTTLKLEIKGMRVFRTRTAYAMLKDLGYKGSRKKVLEDVTTEVERRLEKY